MFDSSLNNPTNFKPDYDAGISIPSYPYTLDNDYWVYTFISASNGKYGVTLNYKTPDGKTISIGAASNESGRYTDNQCAFFIAEKGGIISRGSGSTASCRLYPFKK